MTTVPATGQFGPPLFSVLSRKGAVVDAKWLTDNTGASYIIDPNTGRPYIVPRDYDPSATAVHFSSKLRDSLASPTLDERGASAVQTSVYQELKNAFRQGGWGDLQRPLADKTDVVDAFIPAASFNLGVGAAAGGVSASEAVFFGGAYNVIKNGIWKLINNPLQFGNNPNNPPHIRDGADQFNRGILGVRYSQNSMVGAVERQTAVNATAPNASEPSFRPQATNNSDTTANGPTGVLGGDFRNRPMISAEARPQLRSVGVPNLPSEGTAYSDQSGNASGGPRPETYPRLRSRMVSSAFPGITPRDANPPEPPEPAPLLGIFSGKPMMPLPHEFWGLPKKSGASSNGALFDLLAGLALRIPEPIPLDEDPRGVDRDDQVQPWFLQRRS